MGEQKKRNVRQTVGLSEDRSSVQVQLVHRSSVQVQLVYKSSVQVQCTCVGRGDAYICLAHCWSTGETARLSSNVLQVNVFQKTCAFLFAKQPGYC